MPDVFQALSSPVRREILAMLKVRDMTAGDIALALAQSHSLSKSTLSGHFNVLKAADMVLTQRQATTITYSLNTSVVEDMLSGLMGMFGDNNGKTSSDKTAGTVPDSKTLKQQG